MCIICYIKKFLVYETKIPQVFLQDFGMQRET
jgi:hypothetical protein